ncbi:sporulation protein YqfD [Caproiciproducens faecalis]|uniref:Sporulation protein YqfD n=1 Tax=Caproiciproducens faecalis TaxID=2820301 RepID=A0ABS7DKK2_9FIRM|nr:sporulation protein YqfD [Caproiciproducens faecalis]MBW7571649.1 sporulation protein YqfD [Caproiciproducens faecalis]
MISLHLTRWLLGYARFSVVGGSHERFLNNCARSGIYLWDITGGKDGGACVAVQSYRALRPCARRANAKLKVRERHGFPFATKGIRKRRGILAGAVLFMVIVQLLSLHVWSIEVAGNSSIPTEQIEAELVRLGVTPGTLKSKVQPQMLQQKLMLEFPQIGWLSVNTRGCSAQVQLQEKVDRPLIVGSQGETVCNIKAARTGQIVSMNVFTGTAQVSKGDAVVEGQLLISCVVEDKLGYMSLRHAAGKIIAETSRSLTTEVDLKRAEVNPTGKTLTRRCLYLFGARVPLTFAGKPEGEYRAEGVHTDLKLMNAVLPLGFYEEKWTEEKSRQITLTKDQAIAEAKRLMEQKKKEELKDAKILSVSEDTQFTDSRLIYAIKVKCEENIAQESEILIK